MPADLPPPPAEFAAPAKVFAIGRVDAPGRWRATGMGILQVLHAGLTGFVCAAAIRDALWHPSIQVNQLAAIWAFILGTITAWLVANAWLLIRHRRGHISGLIAGVLVAIGYLVILAIVLRPGVFAAIPVGAVALLVGKFVEWTYDDWRAIRRPNTFAIAVPADSTDEPHT